ncbi:hypothetical protein PIB30_083766 [Stylosanthes scabra]|uniref:Uncharacterized protein n=1 Tax=Stylosanthes scabra TaxID=79078 RepID=A0ABU6UTJ1_9FABA|nr:hypothetical protein [Stylosanthes scabra]
MRRLVQFEEEENEPIEPNVADARENVNSPPRSHSKSTSSDYDDFFAVETARDFSRGEMFAISHRKKDGTFVNEEAQQKNEDLQKEIGVRPSQVIRSSSRDSVQSVTASGTSRAEYRNLKLQVQLLQEQINFLVNRQGGQLPPNFPTEVRDLGSPIRTRPSSTASHEP